MGLAKTQQRTKMACIQGRKHIGHLQSETQTLPAIPFRGVCDECKAKFLLCRRTTNAMGTIDITDETVKVCA